MFRTSSFIVIFSLLATLYLLLFWTSMGSVKEPGKAKLIVGMIAKDERSFEKSLMVLKRKYGPADYVSAILPFDKTNYYEEEMGKNLQRMFISCRELIASEDLAEIKIFTNSLEFQLSKNSGQREINLDPGYLTAAKLVLATTKDYQHRLYLGKGIYGEVTLTYTRKSFNPWPWTYPDYATKEYIHIFNLIRELYMKQIGEG